MYVYIYIYMCTQPNSIIFHHIPLYSIILYTSKFFQFCPPHPFPYWRIGSAFDPGGLLGIGSALLGASQAI